MGLFIDGNITMTMLNSGSVYKVHGGDDNGKYRLHYWDGRKEASETLEYNEGIVRCRDCMYWQDQEVGVIEIPVCERLCEKHTGKIGDMWIPMGANDFCSKGKRMEG